MQTRKKSIPPLVNGSVSCFIDKYRILFGRGVPGIAVRLLDISVIWANFPYLLSRDLGVPVIVDIVIVDTAIREPLEFDV